MIFTGNWPMIMLIGTKTTLASMFQTLSKNFPFWLGSFDRFDGRWPGLHSKKKRFWHREVKKRMITFWNIVYYWEMMKFLWNFWWRSEAITTFFAHIFKPTGHVIRKLRVKMHFFHFSKTSENTYMTRKIHPPNYCHYGFSSYFGFGAKHLIAIFPLSKTLFEAELVILELFENCVIFHFWHVF